MTAGELTVDGRARVLADGHQMPILGRRAARGGVHYRQVLSWPHATRSPKPSRACDGWASNQVDLYLVHWPQGDPAWAWPGMERSRERGLARSVGVSNFSASEVAAVVAAGTIPPVVNQVQFSPVYYRRALLDACRQRGVLVEAYSSLGTGRHLNHPTVQRVAQRAGRTPGSGAAAVVPSA